MNRVDLDFADWDFFWKIDENDLLWLNPIGNAKFYLVQPEDMVIKPKPIALAPKPYKRQFPPDGKEANKELYYNMNVLAIESLESKMHNHKLGAMDGVPFHCQKGSIIAYKTTFGSYGKFQILSFGRGENGLELYLRYITYRPTGEVGKMSELVTVQDNGWVERFDAQKRVTKNFDKKRLTFWLKDSVNRTFTAGISVEIQNGLLFLTPSNLKWVLLESKQTIPMTHSSIRWTHNPISITTSKNIFMSACVDIQDSLPAEAYTLYLNNKIVNNLSSRKSGVIRDCNSNNSFERDLELQEGQNEIKLVVKSKQGEMQQILNVQYMPNYKRRLALTMGNKDYKQLRRLRNPVRDADSMAATLKSIGCDTLQLNNGTLSEMRAKLAELKRKLKDYDIGIVFFAGHGEQKSGINYLMPIESDSSLSLNEVFDALQDKIGVVFLDACRYEPQRASIPMDKHRTFADVNNVKNNLYIFFASSSGTGASDGMSNHGLFTKHLLRHLKECTPFQTLVDKVISSVSADENENENYDRKQIPSAKSIGEYQGIYLCD
ncbi:MAG: hypothetical protein RLZZ628_1685 [Bacteroidota bacterium]|jgi:hypothetical protein